MHPFAALAWSDPRRDFDFSIGASEKEKLAADADPPTARRSPSAFKGLLLCPAPYCPRRTCGPSTRHGAALRLWAAALCCGQSQRGGIMNRRVRLAPYLSGILYRMRTEAGMFIFFNSLPIARRAADEEAWTVIAPNWKVTDADSRKVKVRYSGNLEVVTSLR
jgi:hypothetical protein